MPKPIVKTSPRGKRAKAEIQQEFSAIENEIQAARESADAKADELARHKESDVRQAVEGVSVDGVVEQISRGSASDRCELPGIRSAHVNEIAMEQAKHRGPQS